MSQLRYSSAAQRAAPRARFTRAAAVAVVALFTLLFSRPVVAQTGTARITGTVTDSSSGRAVGAVQVSLAGTRLGSVTDDEGRFTINGVPAGTYTVDARRLGYQPASVPNVVVADGATVQLSIRVNSAAFTLEAIVSTGLVDPTAGTRVPFTVGRVSADNAPVPASNAVETIQGKVAGVSVITPGQAGGGTNIMLRSPTSINKSNSPLIVVDGVVLSQSFDASTADLESMDIESVEVVKGAAAASLYGSRASAGVIAIRTKRGSGLVEGETRVTARSELGMNSLGGKINWAKNHYYRTNAEGQYVNASGAVVTRAQRVARPVHQRFQDVAYTDPIYDQVDRFFDPGQFYKNSVNLSQNTGRTNWLLSVVNSKEDGVVLNSGAYNQSDVRLNLDHQPRTDLRVGFSGYHSRSHRQNLYGDTFFDLINQAPDVDLRVPDADGTPYAFQGDPEGREENPLYVLATEQRTRKRARTQGSLDTRYSPREWFSVDANVSYDRSDRRNDFFLDQGVKTEGFGTGGLGEIQQVTGTTNALNAAVSANLMGKVGALTARTTLRALMERENNVITDADGTNLTVPGVKSLDNAQNRFVSSTDEDIRSNGYFVSVGADYDGRYIFDGLVRQDGSSLFGPEERWNSYYRVSGAYRLANEKWWPFKMFSEFKLRASQGTAGGRPDFEDQFETYEFVQGGGLVKQTLGNKALKPERSKETELGIDAIVRERWSLQLSYARNVVTDQLVQIPLIGPYGYTSQWQNAGTVTGNTVEGSLEAQLIRRPGLTWRLGIVADRSRNKITEFDRSCFQRNTIQYLCAGETLGSMYGFHFINGTSQLPADAQARASEFQVNDDGLLVWVGPGNQFTEGETKTLWGTSTTIGSNVYAWGMPITQKDPYGNAAVVRIGNGNPKFKWGVSNNVGWRDFTLFALVDAQVGGQVYNQTNQRMYQWARSGDVDQVGKPQELKKTIDYYAALYAANDPTDYFVENAGFVKLREVSVRYRLPRRYAGALSRIGANGLSLSMIGRNLMTFTSYKGYDPEVGNPIVRLDSFDYPRYRTFTGSVEVTF